MRMVQFVSMALECPSCRRRQLPDSNYCDQCGEPLSAPAPVPLPEEEAADFRIEGIPATLDHVTDLFHEEGIPYRLGRSRRGSSELIVPGRYARRAQQVLAESEKHPPRDPDGEGEEIHDYAGNQRKLLIAILIAPFIIFFIIHVLKSLP
jgi:hypothetical protein